MVKLLFCLICALAIATATLQMRQQQLELKHQAAARQIKIERLQAKLWNQQLQIASSTAPNMIARSIGEDMDLVPYADLPAEAADWLHFTGQTDRRFGAGAD